MRNHMFEISTWDGLAKLGTYTVNSKTINTPALFPVVDPKQQTMPIADFQSVFGFNQVITSAYLMSKRMEHMRFDEYPKIDEYLEFDGMVMMDSGAYQVMLYGDIELGVKETLDLQAQVGPDIGVIMDHPIGYDVSYQEAQKRVEETKSNLQASIPLLDAGINWTLPIQGGKYLDLLEEYLKFVTDNDLIRHFNFFALGSVVPVMINQDYLTLVEMIALTRSYLPVNKPLHLFGAGHPAMFALAIFLGCDTFDSAAYILMAKDGRYMTVDGTYFIDDLIDLPCNCPICMQNSAKEIQALKKSERTELLSQHNLYVSRGEIRTIKQHIREGNLWDLVLRRGNAVPHLQRATQRAIELVTSGKLASKYMVGIPVTKDSMIRLTRVEDLDKALLRKNRSLLLNQVIDQSQSHIICLAYPLYRSIYNRLPEYQIGSDPNTATPALFLPPIGLVPLSNSDVYPIGQMINEVSMDQFPTKILVKQLQTIREMGKTITILYQDPVLEEFFDRILKELPDLLVQRVDSLVTSLKESTVSDTSRDFQNSSPS